MLFSRPALKTWGFIILHVGNILERNKNPSLTTEPSTYTHDSHSSRWCSKYLLLCTLALAELCTAELLMARPVLYGVGFIVGTNKSVFHRSNITFCIGCREKKTKLHSLLSFWAANLHLLPLPGAPGSLHSGSLGGLLKYASLDSRLAAVSVLSLIHI